MNSIPETTPRAEIQDLLTRKELFIFDLDGTMFNSLGDLAPAVNFALRQFGIPEISKDNVRSCIGNGSRNLIRRSMASGIMFGMGKTAGEPDSSKSIADHLDVRNGEAVTAILNKAGFDETRVDEVLKTYSRYYWEHCTEDTEPYAGVLEFIDCIISHGKRAAMLTNKPVLPARKILSKFGLIGGSSVEDSTADKIVTYLCGDTAPERKPGPGGIYAILKQQDVPPENTIMIGDDTPDVMAARNAGVDCIVCLKGFGRPENLLPLEPKYTVNHIQDLLQFFSAVCSRA